MGRSATSSIVQQRYIVCAIFSLIFVVTALTRSGMGILVVAMVNATKEHSMNGRTTEGPKNQTIHYSGVSAKAPVYNWSRQTQGFILSSFYWGYITFQIGGGTLAQKYGGKWIVAFGTFGWSILDILTPLSASINPYLLIFITSLKGIFSSVIWPGVFAMFGRWVPPQERGTLVPLTEIGEGIGQAIGAMYAGVACASDALGGWPSVFYINGALGLFALIPWCIFVYNSPDGHPFISSDEVEYIQQSLKSDQKEENKAGIPWRRILLSRGVILLCCMRFGMGWALMMIIAIIPQYIDDVLGLSIQNNSIFNGAVSLSGIVAFAAISRLSDFLIKREWLSKSFVRKLYYSLGTILMSCAFLCLTFADKNTPVAIALIFISCASFQFPFLSLFLLPLDLSQNFCGTVYGVSLTFHVVGEIVTPVIADTLTTNKSLAEWKLVFYLTSGLFLILGVIFPVFGSTEREDWDIGSHERNGNEANEQKLLLQ